MSFHLYALPCSKIYHRIVQERPEYRPHFACNFDQKIHGLMKTRVAEFIYVIEDIYGERKCKRCFPVISDKTKKRRQRHE